MKKKSSYLSKGIFHIVRALVRLFYGKVEIVGRENLPEKNVIIVGNHSQTNGPIIAELFFPKNIKIWCMGQMMRLREVPSYAYSDFWSQKPKMVRPFYKLLSYLIAPLSVCIFTNAKTVPVYRDHRVITTFRRSVNLLEEGENLLIFPEKNEKYNNILYNFEENFVDLARLFYKKTGKNINFVPMYLAPKLKKVYIGKGIEYCGEKDSKEEKKRIISYLMNEITSIAVSLPEHTVVPYRNIPRKYYLSNKDISEVPHEKTGR